MCVCVCVSSESEPGWENDIRDDVLEECSQAGSVYHIHVDKLSQGNVYVKCSSAQVATAAFNRLNGRFFAGCMLNVHASFAGFDPSLFLACRKADCGAVYPRSCIQHQVSSGSKRLCSTPVTNC